MGEGTKTISLADAMARIDSLEENVAVLMALVTNLETQVLWSDVPSATQVAEAA